MCTECSVLYGNKIKHQVHSTIKCIGEIYAFSNTGVQKVSYVLNRSQYGIISGTTHIKIIFNFSPDTDEHFTCNSFWNSDDSITQLFHMFHFSTINIVFYKHPDEKQNLSVLSLLKSIRFLVTIVTMIYNTTVRHVPMGAVFQLHVASPRSLVVFVSFWTKNFLIFGQEEDPFPDFLVFHIWLLWTLSFR